MIDSTFSSHGFICPKGSSLKQLYEDPDRLRTPMIHEGDVHREATWQEAYELIDRKWKAVVDEHGRQATAIYFGNPNAHQFENNLALRPWSRPWAPQMSSPPPRSISFRNMSRPG